MTIIGAKFVNAVRVPARAPTMELSARASEKLSLEAKGGYLVLSYADAAETRSIAVPVANVAYLELESEPKAKA